MVESLALPVFSSEEGASTRPAESLGKAVSAGETVLKEQPSGSAQAAKGAGGGQSKDCEYQPYVFNQGFPPVPAKLVRKILQSEFVDMSKLLRDNIEAERRRGMQGESSNTNPKTPRRDIPDILSWIQCFGIHVSVVASKYP